MISSLYRALNQRPQLTSLRVCVCPWQQLAITLLGLLLLLTWIRKMKRADFRRGLRLLRQLSADTAMLFQFSNFNQYQFQYSFQFLFLISVQFQFSAVSAVSVSVYCISKPVSVLFQFQFCHSDKKCNKHLSHLSKL